MHSLVEPNAWVVLRLPSDTLKILQIVPNTIVSLGKYGTFSSNLLLGRPYNKTYELLDRVAGHKDSDLRIVPAAELHADTIAEEQAAANSSNGAGGKDENVTIGGDGVEFQLVGENGEVIMRSNRETIDDAAQQTLTMEEIEELKREGTGAGKDLIAKLMASHLGIEQKTAFSLAKYKLLKTKKYLRRFTVLPVDVPMLINWVMEEKDAGKIMEMREEMCALVGSWANVHFAEGMDGVMGGRWLVVDETGGLLVAALAERMGILYPPSSSSDQSSGQRTAQNSEGNQGAEAAEEESTKPIYHDPPLATSNTITLIHNNAQPNLSLLKYFSYDPTTSTPTHPNHPLATHLHPISWLQLIDPSQDTTYSTPVAPLSPTTLSSLKSGKRGTYYRKLRRHNRVTSIVDSTLAGGFDGLVVASHMDPISILRHTIPLLRGGAQIAIYSPTIESLVKLSDVYSTSRRTAFIQSPPESFLSLPPSITDDSSPNPSLKPQTQDFWPGNADFPLNPTLLLNTAVQSARIREWQVLPGRTHPVMTGRGGAEGYLFTAVRVIPARGRVEARGKFAKKKVDKEKAVDGKKGADVQVENNGVGDGKAEIEVSTPRDVDGDVDGAKRAGDEDIEMSPSKRVKLAAQVEGDI
ncbi:Gcd10p family-domain-containing protein [Cadophora sp. MPI-SDFR-AT-0126]|nr:Gcd10p family-domain-containing protein [Leotiomycetes sp. MPI-SDFR-AT-0126]